MSEPVRGEPPLPAWAQSLPDPGAAIATWEQLKGSWEPLAAAVDVMSGRSKPGAAESTQQREALLKVNQRLVELSQERGTAYSAAFEAYMLHAGGRCARRFYLGAWYQRIRPRATLLAVPCMLQSRGMGSAWGCVPARRTWARRHPSAPCVEGNP